MKKKILDEVTQLPADKPNIVIFDITHVGAHFEDVEDAFLGQRAIKVNVDKQTRRTWTQEIRNANGIIHLNDGERINAIIAYKFNYENRRIYHNPNARITIPPQIQSKL